MGNLNCFDFIKNPGVTKLVQLAPSPCVNVFAIDLRSATDGLDATCLGADENARAQRFKFTLDRTYYVAAHIALRYLLAQATGVSPDLLAFETGAFGKPALLPCAPETEACFYNLSHSGYWALVGIAQGAGAAEIGVDIEVLRPADDLQDLMEQVLTPGEIAEIQRLDPAQHNTAFLKHWTRKEATLKAWGCGLHLDPKTLGPGDAAQYPPVLVHTFIQETQFVASTALMVG